MAQAPSLPPTPVGALGPRPGSLEPWAMSHEALTINNRSIDKLFDYISIVSDIPSRVSNLSKRQDAQDSKPSKLSSLKSCKLPKFQSFELSRFQHCETFQISRIPISQTIIFDNDLGLALGFVQKIWHVQIDKEGFLRVPKIRTAWTSSVSGLQSVKLGFHRCPVKQNNATFMWEIPSQYLCQWKWKKPPNTALRFSPIIFPSSVSKRRKPPRRPRDHSDRIRDHLGQSGAGVGVGSLRGNA